MRWWLFYLVLTLLSFSAAFLLKSPDTRDFIQFTDDQVYLCSVSSDDEVPPTIKNTNCALHSDNAINPYNKALWILGTINDPRPFLERGVPVSLYISAKASSRVYLNGRSLGENGNPASTKESEIVGQLDSSFYVPRNWLKDGENELAIFMSGHNSFYASPRSVLTIAFGTYREAPFHGGKSYWLAILTFGAFAIGAIYFGASAALGFETIPSFTLSLASTFAAFQLLSEVARGVWAYPYPFHDIRLVLISLYSAGVGLLIALHVCRRFDVANRFAIFSFIIFISVVGLFGIQSFDGQATWVMFVPTIAAALVAIFSIQSYEKIALRYTISLTIFGGLILLNPRQFLDMYYYALLFVLFIYLFVQQAVDIQEAIRSQEKAEASRAQLEVALEKLSSRETQYLLVKSAGRQDKIDMNDIISLSRVDDYISIRLKSGHEILHRTSLKTVQKDLPACFVFVHRSHIININYVKQLERLSSGIGELTLSDDFTVPVSRRIMPRVRKVINAI